MVTAYAKISGNCLLYVDAKIFHDYESAIDLFHIVSFVYVVKFNLDVVGLTDTTVPLAPFIKPAFVSMFRHNMTHAPTANRSLASSPAVMLQSLFSFASFSVVLFHSIYGDYMFHRLCMFMATCVLPRSDDLAFLC